MWPTCTASPIETPISARGGWSVLAMVVSVTFPACFSVRCTDCPGLTGCMAAIRSPAVCTGRPLAAVTMSPGLRPALAAGAPAWIGQQLRAQLLDRDVFAQRALRHHLRGLL